MRWGRQRWREAWPAERKKQCIKRDWQQKKSQQSTKQSRQNSGRERMFWVGRERQTEREGKSAAGTYINLRKVSLCIFFVVVIVVSSSFAIVIVVVVARVICTHFRHFFSMAVVAVRPTVHIVLLLFVYYCYFICLFGSLRVVFMCVCVWVNNELQNGN